MHKTKILLASVLMLALTGCGFGGGGKSSNSFTMSVTTTEARVQDTSTTPPLVRYSGVEVTNLTATPLLVGGPVSRATKVCSDAAACKSASIYVPGSNVWLESSSGTVAGVQLLVMGQ